MKKTIYALVVAILILVASNYKQTYTALAGQEQKQKQVADSLASTISARPAIMEARAKRLEAEAESARIKKAAEAISAVVNSAPKGANGLPCGVKRPESTTEKWRVVVARYFPAEQVDNALKIMDKESGGDSGVHSCTNDHGLMQINYTAHYAKVNNNLEALYDPETNLKVAYQIWSVQGWCPWTTARSVALCS